MESVIILTCVILAKIELEWVRFSVYSKYELRSEVIALLIRIYEQTRYPNMKPLILPWWLKIGYWIGYGGFVLVVLFFLFSGILPAFGALTILEEGRSHTYARYDISCVYDKGSVSLSLHDREKNAERIIDIQDGSTVIYNQTTSNNAITLDGLSIEPKNCTRYQTMIAVHGRQSSKSLQVYEYLLSLDCHLRREHILADLHGYNCWRK